MKQVIIYFKALKWIWIIPFHYFGHHIFNFFSHLIAFLNSKISQEEELDWLNWKEELPTRFWLRLICSEFVYIPRSGSFANHLQECIDAYNPFFHLFGFFVICLRAGFQLCVQHFGGASLFSFSRGMYGFLPPTKLSLFSNCERSPWVTFL